ncbi:MAG: GWxTD domain-containing protein [Candidatus Aminicenantes bacterium]|jgi:GWxTD domain-containing protein
MKKIMGICSIMIVAVLLVPAACSTSGTKSGKEINMEPAEGSFKDDSFFEKARLIMTKQEIEVYKHLPDKQAKEEFIAEFWKKRDPDPETQENENLEEFMERIEYANKWFFEGSIGRGWDTQRGRILLQLGFPEERRWGEVANTDRYGALITSKRVPMEIWTYIRYQLVLVFTDWDGSGKLLLSRIPSNFPYALNRARFSLDLRDQSNLKRAFRFDVSFTENQFEISIPTNKLSFEEKNGTMNADFDITVYVYKHNRKTDEFNVTKSFSMDKEKLLQMKILQFNIPYTVSEKGKYYFDVVIEEKSSGARYRDFTRVKI